MLQAYHSREDGNLSLLLTFFYYHSIIGLKITKNFQTYFFIIIIGILFLFLLYPDIILAQDISNEIVVTTKDSLSIVQPLDSLDTKNIINNNKKNSSQPDTLIKYYGDRSFFTDQKLVLVGNAKLIYKKIILTADTIKLDLESDLVYANHSFDTLYYDKMNGIIDTVLNIGMPTINNNGEIIHGTKMIYNLKTKKGKVENSTTGVAGKSNADSTYLKINNLIMLKNKELNGTECQISSCNNVEKPHYHFKADSIIVKNDHWVFAKPITLYFGNVPVGWFPYILYKMVKGRKSGLIFPSYSYSSTKGNGLKHLGYFWDISEYMDYKAVGDFWDYYGYEFKQIFRYKQRYKLNGYISAIFNNDHYSHDWRFKAVHNHNITPTTRLDVNVDYVTNRSLVDELADNDIDKMENQLYSNFRFFKGWNNTGDNFTLTSNYTQYIDTAIAKYTFPSLNYSLKGRKPFRGINSLPKFLQDYSVSGSASFRSVADVNYDRDFFNLNSSYSSSISHSLRFYDDIELSSGQVFSGYFLHNRTNILSSDNFFEENLFEVSPYEYKDDDKSVKITNSLSYDHKIFSYFNFKESISHRRDIAFRYLDNGSNVTRLDTINAVKTRDIYSAAISSNTKVYGIFQPNIGMLNKVRHLMTPSLSLSYQPDFSDEKYGYFKTALDSNNVEYKYDTFGNSSVGGTSSGESLSLAFDLKNSFDAKFLVGKNKYLNENLFILNFSESYNFVADSNKLSPLKIYFKSTLYNGKIIGNKSKSHLNLKLVLDSDAIVTPYDGTFKNNYINENFDFWNKNPFRVESYNASYSVTLPFNIKEKISRDFFNFEFNGDNKDDDEYYSEDDEEISDDEIEGDDEFVDDTYSDFVDDEDQENKRYKKSDFIDLTYSEKLAFKNLTDMEFDLSGNITFKEKYGSLDTYSKNFYMNLNAMIKPTENWEVGYRMTVNFLLDKEITSTSIVVKRKIHCWEGQFDWDFNRRGFKLLISTTSDVFKDLKFDKDTQR